MKQEETIDHKAIEDALAFMDQGDSMSEEAIEAMMSDEEVACSVRALMEIKQATIAASPHTRAGIDREWERFVSHNGIDRSRAQDKDNKRKTPIYIIMRRIGSVAAAIALVVGVTLYAIKLHERKPVEGMVLAAVEKPDRHPVLTTSGGETIVIDGNEDREELAGMGVGTSGKGMTMTASADETPDKLVLTIPRGQTYKLVLADGSEVWMNNDCRLVYPNRFADNERRVKIEGEAYFKIAPDREHPFIVEANGIEARVLGTEFNVRSYGRDDVHVTLIKGSVEVTSDAEHTARLVPGQDAMLNDDGSLGVAEVDIESYIYWRDGYFYFDNISLENIMQDIGRWYNLNIVFENASARSYHLHFLADKRGGVERVVKLLNSMGKVKVSQKGNTLTIK
ncbi:MAG: FecR family protein [Prevotella sp.]